MLLRRGHTLQGHALQAIPEVPPPADDSLAATSLWTLLAIVQEGIGLTLVPQLAIDAWVAGANDVALVPCSGPARVTSSWPSARPPRGKRSSARSPRFSGRHARTSPRRDRGPSACANGSHGGPATPRRHDLLMYQSV
ncbi:hypothetical protein [Rhodovibrio sodomensis]|uniref:hypothetical protein n=1 Tax=Rhodovibrio sodomensis TaxID=1088 RepID=UPI0019066980